MGEASESFFDLLGARTARRLCRHDHLEGVEVKEGGPYACIEASHHIGGRLRLYSGVQPQPDGCHIHRGQPAHPGKLL